ncbi:MAG TPA: alkaline phosphatase family protein [Gemmatimonadales bacterium]|nr:alkaline phosphatase family protein [Gemmatimonadales bacterium]
MRRLIIVLADGLRPDAVSPSVMPSLDALAGVFTLAQHASTVRPSATVAALASLATGVGPESHRLIEPGLKFLPRLGSIRPVAQVLGRGGVPTDIVSGDLGPATLPVAWALAETAGVRRLTAKGSRARETAVVARRLLEQPEARLLFLYLPDCDRAGHAHGWMSERYLEAAAEVDAAIGLLSPCLEDTVFIVTADHGGGGVFANEHDEPHPVNDHIPLVLAGPGVTRRHQLTRPISLLDIPATVLWWFGIPVPECYEGRPLTEAFVPALRPTAVPA